jgi:hypothetical protein
MAACPPRPWIVTPKRVLAAIIGPGLVASTPLGTVAGSGHTVGGIAGPVEQTLFKLCTGGPMRHWLLTGHPAGRIWATCAGAKQPALLAQNHICLTLLTSTLSTLSAAHHVGQKWHRHRPGPRT